MTGLSPTKKLGKRPPAQRQQDLQIQMIRTSATISVVRGQQKMLLQQEHNVLQSARRLAELARENDMSRRQIAALLGMSVQELGDLTGWDVTDVLEDIRDQHERQAAKRRAERG